VAADEACNEPSFSVSSRNTRNGQANVTPIDALNELALVRQQPHFLTAQNSLGNRKEFKKRGPLSPQGEAALLALFFDIPHRIPYVPWILLEQLVAALLLQLLRRQFHFASPSFDRKTHHARGAGTRPRLSVARSPQPAVIADKRFLE
jgi:hypothetical protein